MSLLVPGCTHITTTGSNAGITNRGQVIAVAIVPEPEIYALILASWRGWFYRSIFAMNRLRKNFVLVDYNWL
jgi:hypothetical protein